MLGCIKIFKERPTSHSCSLLCHTKTARNGRQPASGIRLPKPLSIQILESLTTQRRVSLDNASSQASTKSTIPRETGTLVTDKGIVNGYT